MTVKIRLKNGLYATIRRLSDPRSKPVADALCRRFYCSSFTVRFYHVVSIRVKKELVHFIVPRQNRNKPVKILATMLIHNLKYTLGFAAFIVYDGACHAYGEPAAHIICTAIVNRRKPSVQAVLCGPNEPMRKW